MFNIMAPVFPCMPHQHRLGLQTRLPQAHRSDKHIHVKDASGEAGGAFHREISPANPNTAATKTTPINPKLAAGTDPTHNTTTSKLFILGGRLGGLQLGGLIQSIHQFRLDGGPKLAGCILRNDMQDRNPDKPLTIRAFRHVIQRQRHSIRIGFRSRQHQAQPQRPMPGIRNVQLGKALIAFTATTVNPNLAPVAINLS